MLSKLYSFLNHKEQKKDKFNILIQKKNGLNQ